MKTDFNQIENLIKKLEKIKQAESAVEKNPSIKNKKVISKLILMFPGDTVIKIQNFTEHSQKIMKKFLVNSLK